jgi:hypothetical protein
VANYFSGHLHIPSTILEWPPTIGRPKPSDFCAALRDCGH